MKRILAFAMLLTMSAGAQVKPQIQDLLREIKEEVSHTQDRQILMRVKRNLERTLDILTDQGHDPGPRPSPRGSLSCVARDNDGQNPWVLAVKDPITLRKTKLPASNIGSLNNCNIAKENAIFVRNSVFVCIARDNDGQNPYVIAHYRDNKLVRKVNNLGSLDNCVSALRNAARSHAAVAFCATRDNDGQNPYVEMSVVADTGAIHRAGSYSNLQQCLSSSKKKEMALKAK